MSQATEDTVRPTGVSVLAWVSIVLSTLAVLRGVLNLVTWKILETQSPSMLAALEQRTPHPIVLGPLFKHFVAWNVGETIAAAAVIVVGVGLLRMRRWALTLARVLCGLGLVWVAGLETLWFVFWPRLAEAAEGDTPLSETERTRIFVSGLGVGVLLFLLLGAVLVYLSGARVRTFGRGGRVATGSREFSKGPP